MKNNEKSTEFITHQDACWQREFGKLHGKSLHEIKLAFSELSSMFSHAFRFVFLHQLPRALNKGVDNFKTPFGLFGSCGNRITLNPDLKGPPLGGIGSVSFTRSWMGDFSRHAILSGTCKPCDDKSMVGINNFSLCIQKENGENDAVVLNCSPFDKFNKKKNLSGWNWWNLGKDNKEGGIFKNMKGKYYCRYPLSFYEYGIEKKFRIVCKQFSPIIKNNYKETSYPVSIFKYRIENKTEEKRTFSLMFTFLNGIGDVSNDTRGGHENQKWEDDQSIGVELKNNYRFYHRQSFNSKFESKDPVSFSVATEKRDDVKISIIETFKCSEKKENNLVWEHFKKNGDFDSFEKKKLGKSKPKEQYACAVCVKVTVDAKSEKEVVFSLGWDVPLSRFGENCFFKKYTEYFGKTGDISTKIAQEGIKSYREWEKAIDEWQAPILENPDLPDNYKRALFNELYYIVDGGSVWTTSRLLPEKKEIKQEEHFSLLESHEYLMFNTYDVYVYGSFAVLYMFPELQKIVQKDFARAIKMEIKDEVQFSSGKSQRKIKNHVPHDMGAPGEAPFDLVNSYRYQNTNRWKDLNCHYILALLRDVTHLNDDSLLEECFESAKALMNRQMEFVNEKNGLVENEDFPDQTYDTWSMPGVNCYCSNLWISAIRAYIEMMKRLVKAGKGEKFKITEEEIKKLEELLKKGVENFEKILWNEKGNYYNHCEKTTSIHLDSHLGHLFLKSCGLEGILSKEKMKKGIESIYNMNIVKGKGSNGMTEKGEVDLTSNQSKEIWTGSNYAFAAILYNEGMKKECFFAVNQIFNTCWNENGFYFQTPEAYDHNGGHRALCYNRPLSIWAVQYMIELKK